MSRRRERQLEAFAEVMRRSGSPEAAVASFLHHLVVYLDDRPTTLSRSMMADLAELPDAGAFADLARLGTEAADRVAIVKLNGGLGTGMGLERAKSLLEVRDRLSFLDLIARQVMVLRQATGREVPLLLMNSFRTELDSERVLARYPGLAVAGLPLGFRQHRVPKLAVESGLPALDAADPELAWCPPGHGDLYTAMQTTGILDGLLERGIEYAFVSNADNLGAVFDEALLGYMVAHGLGFLMETADRTPADRKGGHLCRLSDGRLALRESAQCPPDELADFQDITRHRYFNTNNVWVHLPSLERLLDDHAGVLPLTTIVNRKTLDPRDPSSPPVVQLETALGSAISLFDAAAAVRVPRHRFSPVKNTDDLLAVRSDAYVLTDDSRVVLHPERQAPPAITLDPRYFKLIDDFERRFPNGPPSLIACDALEVDGDVTFPAGVRVRGRAAVSALAPATLPQGAVLEGEISL